MLAAFTRAGVVDLGGAGPELALLLPSVAIESVCVQRLGGVDRLSNTSATKGNSRQVQYTNNREVHGCGVRFPEPKMLMRRANASLVL